MPPKQAAVVIVDDQEQYDKICKTTFRNFDLFHKHKVHSKKHVTCDKCSADFYTNEALDFHRKQNHAKEQCLACPGCDEVFIRLGSLISHIELTTCQSLKMPNATLNYDDTACDKMTREEQRRIARNYIEYGQTSGDFSFEPMPKFEDEEELVATTAGHGGGVGIEDETVTSLGGDHAALIDLGDPVSTLVPDDEDLLCSYDEPSQILNAAWDAPIVMANEFPPLESGKFTATTNAAIVKPTPFTEIKNPWERKENLFPNTAPVIAPPTEFLKSLTVAAEPKIEMSPFDPDNPKFKGSSYYNNALGKYICPHTGCKKTIAKTDAFIQHLKSATHRNLKLQCAKCLRYFNNATGLTQHSEAQGVRCSVRETDQYDSEVFRFTGKMAATAGKLEDSTVRYMVTKTLKPDATGAADMVSAHRAAAATQSKKKEEYWANHTPKW